MKAKVLKYKDANGNQQILSPIVISGSGGGPGLPKDGEPGQVLTKTEEGAEWQDTAQDPDVEYNNGINTVTTLTKVSTIKRLVIANIQSSQSLTLASVLPAGKELHIIVNNTGSYDITVTIPTSFKSKIRTIDIDTNDYVEINILSDGTKMYVRAD